MNRPPQKNYREQLPSSQFRDFIECLWYLESSEACTQRVPPDGCCDILLFSNRSANPDAVNGVRLVGAMTRFTTASLTAGDRLFGIRFKPGGLYPWLTTPASDFTDRIVPMPEETHLQRRIAAVHAFSLSSLESFSSELEKALGYPPRSAKILTSLNATMPDCHAAIADLEREASRSSRHFRRLCTEETGLSPKQLLRILRFRCASRLLREASRVNLTSLAVDCGYYDQSHMTLDFRSLSGLTPSQHRPQD